MKWCWRRLINILIGNQIIKIQNSKQYYAIIEIKSKRLDKQNFYLFLLFSFIIISSILRFTLKKPNLHYLSFLLYFILKNKFG